MSEEHDKTHRLLFAFPRMVEDLIRLCLGGEWIERLDFGTLEKVPERLLSPELIRREQDVLWRLRYLSPEEEDSWFYIYLHLEHLSRPKRLMALDTTTYKLLVLQELARRKALTDSGRRKKLPPIFSVVLYTGERKWRAITSLLDLLKPMDGAPEGLDLWSFRYIDLQRFPIEEEVGFKSPLLGLFQLERLENLGELPDLARQIQATLQTPEDQDLAGAFVNLINEVVLRRLTLEGAPMTRITDLEEVPSMLAQKIDSITLGWELQGWEKGEAEGRRKGEAEGRRKGEAEGRRKGEAEGRRKGEAEGRKQAAAHMFLELYGAKFGSVPEDLRRRATAAKQVQLETWAKRLLNAESPEDVLEE